MIQITATTELHLLVLSPTNLLLHSSRTGYRAQRSQQTLHSSLLHSNTTTTSSLPDVQKTSHSPRLHPFFLQPADCYVIESKTLVQGQPKPNRSAKVLIKEPASEVSDLRDQTRTTSLHSHCASDPLPILSTTLLLTVKRRFDIVFHPFSVCLLIRLWKDYK